MGCVCTYKHNRVGAWCWTLAHSKPYCLLLTHTLVTFSFYGGHDSELDGLEMDAAFQEGKRVVLVYGKELCLGVQSAAHLLFI